MGTPIIMQFLVLATLFLAAAEATPWGYYGYWPRYYHHAGTPLGPASIANIDYGKTGIKYNVKRSAEADPGVSAPFPANIKMENIDYGKTQIKYLTKRSAEPSVNRVLGPVKMEDIDYGKTKIKYLTKRSADASPHAGWYYGYWRRYYHNPYPASIANIDYGKTGIKYGV